MSISISTKDVGGGVTAVTYVWGPNDNPSGIPCYTPPSNGYNPNVSQYGGQGYSCTHYTGNGSGQTQKTNNGQNGAKVVQFPPPDNVVISDVAVIPIPSEISNVAYNPVLNRWEGIWTAARGVTIETTKWDDGHYVTRAYGVGDTYFATAAAAGGPWTAVSSVDSPSPSAVLKGICICNNAVIVGSDIGIFRSVDLGQTYKFIGGPKLVQQVCAWRGILFAVNLGAIGNLITIEGNLQQQQTVFVSASYDQGDTWEILYQVTKYPAGFSGVYPICVLPLDDGPIILDDTIQKIVGYENSHTISVLPQGAFSIPGIPAGQWSPLYLGTLNGLAYVCVQQLRNDGTNGYNIYTYAANGTPTLVGTVDETLDANGQLITEVVNGVTFYVYTYTGVTEAEIQDPALSCGCTVDILGKYFCIGS